MVETACRQCEKPMLVKPSRLIRTPNGIWCSWECKSLGMQKPATWAPIPAEAGYIAGVLDGEGAVFIQQRKQKGSRFRYAYLAVCITNTDRHLMDFIVKSVGHGVRYTWYEPRPRLRKNGTPAKQIIKIWFTHHRAVAFLQPLLPYLIVKRDKALVGIEFQRLPLQERQLEAQGEHYQHLVNVVLSTVT